MYRENLSMLIIILLIILVACQTADPQPTPVATAVAHTPAPTVEQPIEPPATTTATTIVATVTPMPTLEQPTAPPPTSTITPLPEDPFAVVNLKAIDVRNENNAADIQVRFKLNRTHTVTGYQLAIVKADTADRFTQDNLLELAADRTLNLPPQTEDFQDELPANLLDSDGDAISEGTPYYLFVLTQHEEGMSLARTTEPLTLVNETAVRTLVANLPASTGGVAVNSDGLVHVANIGPIPSRNGKEIYQITEDGEAAVWVSGQGLNGASGNTFDAQGNLIQSSLLAGVVHQITPDGTVTELVREDIVGPVGVIFDSDGTLYVANCTGKSIQRVLPDGTSTTLAEDVLQFRCPNGIAVDEGGNVYMSNFGDGMVFKVTPDGTIIPLAELPGRNNAHLAYRDGLLYVVSRGSHQVYTITLDGEVTLFAGTGERGHGDGSALQATFSLPNDIVFSPDGRRLYLNEVAPVTGSHNTPSYVRIIELPREE